MKPLSEQLEDLSKRAKQAEDHSAAAQTEARAEVQTRIDQLKSDAATRTTEIKAATASTKATAAKRWAALQGHVQEQVNGFNADMAAIKAEAKADQAVAKAEFAEDNAAGAIDFALAAIDNAEWAVLDAIAARADADAATAGA
jgi:uncharacterized protein YicC (UPF0701 family)